MIFRFFLKSLGVIMSKTLEVALSQGNRERRIKIEMIPEQIGSAIRSP